MSVPFFPLDPSSEISYCTTLHDLALFYLRVWDLQPEYSQVHRNSAKDLVTEPSVKKVQLLLMNFLRNPDDLTFFLVTKTNKHGMTNLDEVTHSVAHLIYSFRLAIFCEICETNNEQELLPLIARRFLSCNNSSELQSCLLHVH